MKRDSGEGDEVRPHNKSKYFQKAEVVNANVPADAAQHVLRQSSQLWQGLRFLARSMNWPDGQEGTTRVAKPSHEVNVCRKINIRITRHGSNASIRYGYLGVLTTQAHTGVFRAMTVLVGEGVATPSIRTTRMMIPELAARVASDGERYLWSVCGIRSPSHGLMVCVKLTCSDTWAKGSACLQRSPTFKFADSHSERVRKKERKQERERER